LIALISDIHSNLAALRAVLQDIRKRPIDRIFCLGDVVGYGPNPLEVLDFMRNFEFCLVGNHDDAVINSIPPAFNPIAAEAARWTKLQINPDLMGWKRLVSRRGMNRRILGWQYLKSLPVSKRVDKIMFAHDTPYNPGCGAYVLSDEDARMGFEEHPDINTFFIGHTHRPHIWREDTSFVPEVDSGYSYEPRQLVDIGAVGQPRDGNPDSSYVILDKTEFRFIRVPYNCEKTVKDIQHVGLDRRLADRLKVGK
jgi:predicted phosphodiesterase